MKKRSLEAKNSINSRFVEAVEQIISIDNLQNKAKIAEILELKPSTFSEILKKRTNVSADVINLFCDSFGVSPNWVLSGEGEMFKKNYFSDLKFYPHDNYEEETVGKDYIIEIQKRLIDKLEEENRILKEELKAKVKTS